MNIIIYKREDNSICIVYPNIKNTNSLEDIAKQTVPSGLPYWFADNSVLPEDRTDRDRWTIDEDEAGTPNGYGEAV